MMKFRSTGLAWNPAAHAAALAAADATGGEQ